MKKIVALVPTAVLAGALFFTPAYGQASTEDRQALKKGNSAAQSC